MFWPFKRTPVQTLEEAVKDKPMPRCGKKTAHYNLTFQGAPCFECAAIRRREKQEEDENRLADKIATRVAALIAQKGQP